MCCYFFVSVYIQKETSIALFLSKPEANFKVGKESLMAIIIVNSEVILTKSSSSYFKMLFLSYFFVVYIFCTVRVIH